ncbi:pentatricopeptide repeat superfamily protein [Tanacetum coccineum]
MKQYEQISKTCRWWYCKITPPGYKWKPKSRTVNVKPNLSLHLGTKSRTTNILEPTTLRKSTVSNTSSSSNSFAARTVKFRNDQIALILGYRDLVQGKHRRLSHLNFDTINLLSKYDIVTGLPKLIFVKDHLCSSCKLGKAKRGHRGMKHDRVTRDLSTPTQSPRSMSQVANSSRVVDANEEVPHTGADTQAVTVHNISSELELRRIHTGQESSVGQGRLHRREKKLAYAVHDTAINPTHRNAITRKNRLTKNRIRASAGELSGPVLQPKPRLYHPSKDISDCEESDENGYAILRPAETSRTIIEANSKGLLMFSGLVSDGVYENIFLPDLPYVKGENGDIYFQVKNNEDILETLASGDKI